jgi:crotonobetainyl-CoA:carnitine CoA-transferase CaiB-like acyl-CoA transferase
MSLPLAGIRVVEVAHYVAVPAAGTLLADLGAEVIKVELPPKGEIYRRSRLKYAGYDSEFPEFPPFQMDNRGKRSIVLDLVRPEAREALVRMLAHADVFITNLLPARRQKYGLDHASLLARYPRLVMGAISGYGFGGEESDRPAFDYAAYWARTGMMDLMRDEGVPPSLQRPGVGDHAAASNLVCGILAALRLVEATGQGRYVDVSLLQTGFHVLGNDLSTALVTRQMPKRHDRRNTPNPLWNSYEVAGGRWVLLVMIDANRYWEPFCAAIGRPELREDARFADPFERARNAPALVAEIEKTLAERTLDEWRTRFDAAGLIWSPVNRIDEAIDDPQARALGYIRELEHASAGPFETVGPPFRIEGLRLGASKPISDLHADAEAILREAGLAEEEIRRLL